jgi:transposase
METDRITMTGAEQRRVQAVTQVLAGKWRVDEAALSVGLSVRQVRRLVRAYERDGPAGLVHGNRGRPAANRLAEDIRAQVVVLARGRYAGFNQQHFTEQLAEVEGLVLSRMSVRRILAAAGIGSPRRRRAPKHRSRRERMPQAGMLLQADGSRHQWLGEGHGYLTLIGGIDDATGTVPWALFRGQEDAQGYMLWLRQVVESVGIPQALYVDRHGIFVRSPNEKLTRPEELTGRPVPTQFARVMAELGITAIHAQSPQAKGRVERLWGTFQDRLVGELRLAGARTEAEANAVLAQFLPAFNTRFAVPAAEPGSAYRQPSAGFAADTVLCFKYDRVVRADNTVQLGEHRLQLLADDRRLSWARTHVEVHERLDGSLAVYHEGRCLVTRPAPAEAPVLRAREYRRLGSPPAPSHNPPAETTTPVATAPPPSDTPSVRPAWKPGPNHKWRRDWKPKQRTESLVN